jgi:hypothetical protein
MDKDFCPIAYGKWWEAKQVKDGKWSFATDADHSRTSGGEFVWGAYGVGVDFAKFSFSSPSVRLRLISSFHRAHGLVEIFWRGQLDYHGTLHSVDERGYTRWGTSIQITTQGVNAMKKVWNVEQLAQSGHNVHRLGPKSAARITTAQERVEKAQVGTVSIDSIFILLY